MAMQVDLEVHNELASYAEASQSTEDAGKRTRGARFRAGKRVQVHRLAAALADLGYA